MLSDRVKWPQGYPRYTKLAVTESGHAVAIWEDGPTPHDLMRSVLEPAPERWQAPTTVFQDVGQNAVVSSTLLADRAGNVWFDARSRLFTRFDSASASWSEPTAPPPDDELPLRTLLLRGDGRQPLVFDYPRVSFFDAQQNVWSTPPMEPDAYLWPPSVSVDDRGNVIVAWLDVTPFSPTYPLPIFGGASARFFDRASNAWLPVQKLAEFRTQGRVRTAFDGDGDAHVLVNETESQNSIEKAYRFDVRARTWALPGVAVQGSGLSQVLIRDGRGDVQSFGERCDANGCQLVTTRFNRETDTWQAPDTLAAPSPGLRLLTVDATLEGRALAVWKVTTDADSGASSHAVWAAHLQPSGSWATPAVLDEVGDYGVLSTSLAANGNSAVGWATFEGVRVARFDVNAGRWTPFTAIQSDDVYGNPAYEIALGVDSQGRVTAVWSHELYSFTEAGLSELESTVMARRFACRR